MEFHGEGDNTGEYMLSGLWRLTRRHVNEGKQAVKVLSRPSWSGDGWRSPARPSVPEVSTVLVALNSRGTFRSPPDTEECRAVRGSWSCDGRDVTLARFGRGSQVIEWYSGTLRAADNVTGTILHGAHDPEFSGTFSMKPAMPQLHAVRKRETVPKGPTFKTSDLLGNWTLEFTSSSSASMFAVELAPDLTWRSVGGLGDASLAGKWNVFDDKINLGSGINGTGNRLWIWLRRFGTAGGTVTAGVALNADQLYFGKISKGVQNDGVLVARSVKGTVALGWSIEPAFIGRFHMKRWVPREGEDDLPVTLEDLPPQT